MGETADSIVNGEVCQYCQQPNDHVWGYPWTCKECEQEDKPKKPKAQKSKCPVCDKSIKQIGFMNHVNDEHPEMFSIAFKGIYLALKGHIKA